jgi:hypothetical protein
MEGSERRMFLRTGLAIAAAALADLSVSNSASTQAANPGLRSLRRARKIRVARRNSR